MGGVLNIILAKFIQTNPEFVATVFPLLIITIKEILY